MNFIPVIGRLLVTLALIASGLAATPARNQPRGSSERRDYTYFDLIPSYWRFTRATAGNPNGDSSKRFDSNVIDPNREVFEAVAFGWTRGENVGKLVKALKGKEADLRLVESQFPSRFQKAWQRFKKDTPAFHGNFGVYLVPAPRNAVGGAVRPLSHRDAVVFGAEEIRAVIDSQESFDVLVQHELTHLYHMQVNDEMRQMIKTVYMPPFAEGQAKLYQVMWLEGLAVYHSKALNPSATLKETVLSSSVAQEVESQWPRLGSNLQRVLDSARSADINAYLFDGPNGAGIPKRAGYYIGMLVVKYLSATHSFAELCRLRGPSLRNAVEQTLEHLETRKLQATSYKLQARSQGV